MEKGGLTNSIFSGRFYIRIYREEELEDMRRIAFLLVFLFVCSLYAIDDYWHYTDVGDLRLTVTNFGVFGNGFSNPDQPSCEYPASSNIETIYRAGLWIGALKNGVPYVSTGAIDAGAAQPGVTEGFEFYATTDPGDTILMYSTIETSPCFSFDAISEQDFVCNYNDYNIEVVNHTPLYIDVHQETYAWSYPFANSFVILRFRIKNSGTVPLESLYVGIWVDATVGNTEITNPFEREWNYYDDIDGYIDSLRLAWERDFDGEDGFAEVYVGVKSLGMDGIDNIDSCTYYNYWLWRTTASEQYPVMPTTDEDRYSYLSTSLEFTDVITNPTPEPSDWVFLISVGPYPVLEVDSSFEVAFAIVGGKWFAPGDTAMDEFFTNARWAQVSYDNDYKLPSPPPSPQLTALPGDGKVTLRWDNSPEDYEDPITHEKDFEGYRVYRSTDGENFILLRQFDKVNDVGYNTGLVYEFTDSLLHNGWLYYYAVTSFDKGDPENDLPSLESSVYNNVVEVSPGTPPDTAGEVYVYPNPYRAYALWDGSGDTERRIVFANLPEHCIIRIYTLSGYLVAELEHSNPYSGEESWNLITDKNQTIATGMYLFAVKDLQTGRIRRGKFVVIK